MASRGRSTQQRASRQRERIRAEGRYDSEGGQEEIPDSPTYCAVCFLTFGNQERRAVRGGKATHLRCVGRLGQAEVT
jgi:hypothetical protein